MIDIKSAKSAIAKYDFVGKNNDELNFSKNDIILITQQLDGGWWEGSINGKIGWFPANFVGIVNEKSDATKKQNLLNGDSNLEKIDSNHAVYRNQIVSEYIKNEKQHIDELEKINNHSLLYLKNSQIFTDYDIQILNSNLVNIIQFKKHLLKDIEHGASQTMTVQRFGENFLSVAPKLKLLMVNYCENHPLCIDIINKNKNCIIKTLSPYQIDIKELITGLSLVFRRLQKYPTFLQEVERNTDETHADKGNLQRAITVYHDISNFCIHLRKQKEIQLEFLSLGLLKIWFGDDYKQQLGQIFYMSSVTVSHIETSNDSKRNIIDRCLILFENSILLLEVLIDSGSYNLDDKISTFGLEVSKNDTNFSLTINKNFKSLFQISVTTYEDYTQMIAAFSSCKHIKMNDSFSVQTISPTIPFKIGADDIKKIDDISTGKKQYVSNLPQAHRAQLRNKHANSAANFQLNHELEMILPDGLDENKLIESQNEEGGGSTTFRRSNKLWTGNCLRPIPAYRGTIIEDLNNSKIKLRKGNVQEEQEEAYLIKIIEGYYHISSKLNTSIARSQNFLNTTNINSMNGDIIKPQLIVADEERIFVEEMEGDEIVVKEKSLVDTVYSLKDQIGSLHKELILIAKTLDKEQKARRRLEEFLRRSSQQYSLSSTPKPTSESLDEHIQKSDVLDDI